MNLSAHQTDHQWLRELVSKSPAASQTIHISEGESVSMADDYVANEGANEFESDDAAVKTRGGRGKRGKSEAKTARVSSGAKSASILRKSATSPKTRSSAGRKRSSGSSKSNPLSRSRSVKSATKTANKTVSSARGKTSKTSTRTSSRTSGPALSSVSASSRRTTKKSVKAQSSRAKKRMR
jgi:hypothetical protein